MAALREAKRNVSLTSAALTHVVHAVTCHSDTGTVRDFASRALVYFDVLSPTLEVAQSLREVAHQQLLDKRLGVLWKSSREAHLALEHLKRRAKSDIVATFLSRVSIALFGGDQWLHLPRAFGCGGAAWQKYGTEARDRSEEQRHTF